MIRVPLPQQVAATIRQYIQSGQWESGIQVPSEDEIGRMFGVSRATVREAVSDLVSQGYLVKRRGIGTFVREKHAISSGLETLISITELIERHGFLAGTQDLQIVRRSATQHEKERFAAWKTNEVAEITRVRTADTMPVLYCIDVFPAQFLLPENHQISQESLFRYFEEQWNQVVIFAQTEIDVVTASKPMATSLHIEPGNPLQCLRQAHYNQNSTLLLWSDDHFLPGTFHFNVMRHRQ